MSGLTCCPEFDIIWPPYRDLMYFVDRMPCTTQIRKFLVDYSEILALAKGSEHNHQAYPGGYLGHVVETLNISAQLFDTFDVLRALPFTREDVWLVLFLHDIEKPFRQFHDAMSPLGHSFKEFTHNVIQDDMNDMSKGKGNKRIRKLFREQVLKNLDILLTPEQSNAFAYVEGEGDDYSGSGRTMNELAAFCHCCDVLSARLWHDKGKPLQTIW